MIFCLSNGNKLAIKLIERDKREMLRQSVHSLLSPALHVSVLCTKTAKRIFLQICDRLRRQTMTETYNKNVEVTLHTAE